MAASISFFEVPVDRVEELDRICFEGYRQGLRDAAGNGNPGLVRTGYVVPRLMLRYPVGGHGRRNAADLSGSGRPGENRDRL